MISFVSLLLGLVAGIRSVEVQVGEPVAAVEIRLDGREVAVLAGEPWSLAVDFGRELEPHRLEAVARDAEAREVGRVEQWINLPRPPAESRLFVERTAGDHWVAHLSWESVVGTEPEAVSLELDGVPLEVADPHRFELPPLDAGRLHFLRAELELPEGVTSSAEATFGGQYSDTLRTDLTAVPVWLDKGADEPSPEHMEGWLDRRGEPLTVVAVEQGAADVVLVPGPGASAAVERMSLVPGAARVFSGVRGHRFAMVLKKDQRLRFLLPQAESRRGVHQGFDVFPSTPELTPRDGGVFWQLTGLATDAQVTSRPRLADAVAVAALLAAERNRRRAVVLLDTGGPDHSRFDPALVRRYLSRLRVPLVIWSLAEREDKEGGTLEEEKTGGEEVGGDKVVGEKVGGTWGDARPVESLLQLERAVRALARSVDRQRIVWVEGTWLPQEITLGPKARGVRLATTAPLVSEEEDEEDELDEAGSAPEVGERGEGGLGAVLEGLVGGGAAGPASVFDVGRAGARPPAAVRADSGELGGFAYREARLERARELLGPEVGSLGPWALLTDVEDGRLLETLGRRAATLEAAYRRRTGLAPRPAAAPEVVLLFAREATYRAYEAGEGRLADLGLAGHGGGGLASLWIEGRPVEQSGALLVHELTHLINRRALREGLPPWLDEGLADDLGFARAGRDGAPLPGTLWGQDVVRERQIPLEPGRVRLEQAREIGGARAALSLLRQALDAGEVPPLREFLALSPRQFVEPEGRTLRYPLAAFFVRFLFAGEARAERFRAFLASVAAGGPADGEALLRSLGTSWDELQRELERWVRERARKELGP